MSTPEDGELSPTERDRLIGELRRRIEAEQRDDDRLELAEQLVRRLESAPEDGGGDTDDAHEASYQCQWLAQVVQAGESNWLWAHYLLAVAHADAWFVDDDIADLDKAIDAVDRLNEFAPSAETLTSAAESRLRRQDAAPKSDGGDVLLTRAFSDATRALEFEADTAQRVESETVVGLVGASLVIHEVDVTALGFTRLTLAARAVALLTRNLQHVSRTSRLRYPLVRTLADLHHERATEEALRPPNVGRAAEMDLSVEYARELADDFEGADSAKGYVLSLHMRIYDGPNSSDLPEAIDWLQQITNDADDVDAAHLCDLAELYLDQAGDSGDQNLVDKAIALVEPLVGARGAVAVDDDTVIMAAATLVEAYSLSDTVTDEQLAAAEHALAGILADARGDRSGLVVLAELHCAVVAERALRTSDPHERARARALLRDALDKPIDEPGTVLTFVVGLATVVGLAVDHGAPTPSWSVLRLVSDFPDTHVAGMLRWCDDRLDRIPDTEPDSAYLLAAVGLLRADCVPPLGTSASVRRSALVAAVAAMETARTGLAAHSGLWLFVTRRLAGQCAELGHMVADLESYRRGIELFDACLAEMPSGHPMRSGTLVIFGLVILSANVAGHLGRELEHARAALVEAAADTGQSAELRAMFLASLAYVDVGSRLHSPGRLDLTPALNCLRRAVDLLPRGHVERINYRRGIAELLIDRFQRVGDIQDVETALALLRVLHAELPDSQVDTAEQEAEILEDIAMAEALLSSVTGDHAATVYMEKLIALLTAQIQDMESDADAPPDTSRLVVTKLQLAGVLVRHSRQTNDISWFVAAAEQASGAAAVVTSPDSLLYFSAHVTATVLECGVALNDQDLARFRAAAEQADRLCRELDDHGESAVLMTSYIGMMWLVWAKLTGDRTARNTGLEHFERSRLPSSDGVALAPSADMLDQVAQAYWDRGEPGDAGRAVDTGLAALQEQAVAVVLQADVDKALIPVADAARRASALAARCLAVGQRADAVRAIEAGRGLVLYAVGWTSDVSTLLREAGRNELAEEWDRNTDVTESQELVGPEMLMSDMVGAGPAVPEDLRHRVVRALSAVDAERVLAAPPTVDDITESLHLLDLDVLMYLVPAIDDRQGRALLVTADGDVVDVPLPLLRDGVGSPVPSYVASRQAVEADGLTREEWRRLDTVRQRALVEVCRWAWRAVVGAVLPHLRRAAGGRLPRLAVVPTGALNVVPWHAARQDSAAGPHYAVEDAVFSYVSSARQLRTLAARPRRQPGQSPVVFTDPTGDLVAAPLDAKYLHRYYGHARFFGVPSSDVPTEGTGTPQELLATLPTRTAPGASLLHVGCHAVSGTSPVTSYLLLDADPEADDDRLTMERILRWTQRQPSASHARYSGLVVLATCQSNLTQSVHDEGLTLCSAFVASGATGVTATLWSVSDEMASVLLCRYHEAIAIRGTRPMDALREAQLWALEADRAKPEAWEDGLAWVAEGSGLRAEVAWAAYSHCGW